MKRTQCLQFLIFQRPRIFLLKMKNFTYMIILISKQLKLVKLYFSEEIAKKYKESYIDLHISGAHVKDLQRTAQLLSKKYDKTLDEVFMDSLKIMQNSFSTTLTKKTGF